MKLESQGGQKTALWGSKKCIIVFAGQYYDAETGLHYNYHRYYDPKLGRYLRADPIGLVGGIDPYTYVINNPINLIDPSGHVVEIYTQSNGANGSNSVNSVVLPDPSAEILKQTIEGVNANTIVGFKITGHGNETSLNIGVGRYNEKGERKSHLLMVDGKVYLVNEKGEVVADFAALLKDKLAKDVAVDLNGCDTALGAEKDMDNIAKTLSKNLPDNVVKGNMRKSWDTYTIMFPPFFGDEYYTGGAHIQIYRSPAYYRNGKRIW